jgi:hypothetical protein
MYIYIPILTLQNERPIKKDINIHTAELERRARASSSEIKVYTSLSPGAFILSLSLSYPLPGSSLPLETCLAVYRVIKIISINIVF